MVETKKGDIRRKIEQRPEKDKAAEKAFRKNFPKTYKKEKKERDWLMNYTSKGIDFPEKIFGPYNLVKSLATEAGFSDLLVNPNTDAKVGTMIPFNSLVLPENYLLNLKDLLSSASPDYPKKLAEKGLNLILEQQAQFKKGDTLKGVLRSYIKKEESIVIYEKKQTVLAEIFEIKKQRQKYMISQPSFEKQFYEKNVEEIKLTKQEIKNINELNILNQQLPIMARGQFIEKIKNDPKRNLVYEIATVEALIDVLELGVMNGTQIEEKKVEEYLKNLYPEPILNNKTRKHIGMVQKKIRQKLKESY